MPRIDERVQIVTSHSTIELTWKSREALLYEIRHLESARGIIGAFETIGTSRPVPLTRDDEVLLFEAINQWSQGVTVEGLPAGIWDLRCALAADPHDTPDPE